MYALLGKTLQHSISPAIHAEIFSELGITAEYKLCECQEQELAVLISSRSYQGFNVTIPYKLVVMQYLDGLDPIASQIQAVNTIAYQSGKICGYNTDYSGFASMLKKNKVEVQGKEVVILGVGGSAKTVATYMFNHGAKKVYLVSRNPEKLVLEQGELIDYKNLEKLAKADIIINTTPCGMYPNLASCAVDQSILTKFKVAVDLIYNPSQTLFLKFAQDAGLQTINGLYMLVAQAVHAQEIWQGVPISPTVIEKISKKMQVLYEK